MLLHSFQPAENAELAHHAVRAQTWVHHAAHIWGDALQINPLAVVFVLAGAAGGVWLVIDIVRGTDGFLSFFERVFRRRWPTWAACAAVAALLLNWLWVLRQHFM